jgi:tRNA modification GTPase
MRERHQKHLEKCLSGLNNFKESVADGEPVDLCAHELRVAAKNLSQLTGGFTSEEVLDSIFRDFCVGK